MPPPPSRVGARRKTSSPERKQLSYFDRYPQNRAASSSTLSPNLSQRSTVSPRSSYAGGDEESEDDDEGVYAHKAVVYARAPPSFQQKYFTLSNGAGANPSALSLPLAGSRSPSPAMRPATPDSDGEQDKAQPLTRIRTIHNATLLSKELEYLYTARDFGDAFEFLFDTHDATESRVDKLRKDLVFMWRSRLYADCRLALTSNSAAHQGTTAVFSTLASVSAAAVGADSTLPVSFHTYNLAKGQDSSDFCEKWNPAW